MIRHVAAAVAAVCLFTAVMLTGTGVAQTPESDTPASPVASPAAQTSAVFRETLATGLPPAAPGQTLDLVQYDIPAHHARHPHSPRSPDRLRRQRRTDLSRADPEPWKCGGQATPTRPSPARWNCSKQARRPC
ncbi:MAG: hypothetical protein R2845_13110 [Thermomicrobiales bacterium]